MKVLLDEPCPTIVQTVQRPRAAMALADVIAPQPRTCGVGVISLAGRLSGGLHPLLRDTIRKFDAGEK